MSATRRALVETAGGLLERQGYHATGVNEILAACGLQRGSLYHHFPGGKEALAVAAVEDRARRTERLVERHLAARTDPADAVQAFVLALADHVERERGRAGPPFAAVTLETGAGLDELRRACRDAYAGVRARFAERLVACGHAPPRAASLATVITAAVDGAFVLCRADGDAEPLRETAAELARLLRGARPVGAEANGTEPQG
jgi:TetR/AcrR family transcriptional regulator, lmrAB and yxaGH operons repressor